MYIRTCLHDENLFYTYLQYIIIIPYFGSTSGNAYSALKKINGIHRMIVGYVEMMYLHNYMQTEQNSVRLESMTYHPRI